MMIRKLEERDFLESIKLSMYAFQYTVPDAEIPKRKEMLKEHQIWGIWEKEKLSAKLHILNLKIWLGDTQWDMGGIAGVATYPEYRRKGYVKILIQEALKEMKRSGQHFSFLHPFDISFYRHFGWEIISEYKKVTIPKNDLQFMEASSAGRVERFSKATHTEDLEAVYNRFAAGFSCMLVRDAQWWLDHVYGDLTAAVLYNGSGKPQGYLLYKIKDRVMDVKEFVSLDRETRIQLWNFICQHDSMIDQANFTLSVHDSFPYYLKQPKQRIEHTPYFMGRIVDARAVLKKYPFQETGKQVFLHVSDEYAGWNAGTYLLKDGEITYFEAREGSHCTHPPKKGLHLNINTLSSILLGNKRPMEVYEMGYIAGSKAEVLALEEKIPQAKSFFYDFF
ncbi:GNAT family N-acetyltransferase [Mesobacillus foraminis]|uniref:GNAT family N-acetyltransferase n=1 Tax=Mesobacillus foraminis TaxID=279826 RepID=UPI0039A2F48A